MTIRTRVILVTMAALLGVLILSTAAFASVKQANGPTPTCPGQLVFSGKTGTCVPCPKGTQFSNAKCVLPPPPTCTTGYHYDKTSRKCAPDAPVSAPTTPTTTTIPGCYTDANGVQYCNQTATDTAVESDTKTEKLSIVSGGITQFRWEFPNGWRPKTFKGCIWVTGGKNEARDRNGHKVWLDWTGKRAYICPDKTSSTGWRKAGGPPTWTDCGNEFIPPFMRRKVPLFHGRYRLVQQFTFVAKMTLKLTLHGNVSAEAHCVVGDANNGSSAKANVNGVDTESITVTGTGSGRTWVEAVGNAHQAAISSKEVNDLHASVTATATMNMKGSASVSCHTSPPAPTPPTPTPPTPPTPTPPTPTPVQHSCTASVSNLEKDERTATFSVTCDGTISSAIWSFDGSTGNATGTSVTHTFPNSEAGQTAYGYVTVYFADNTKSWSGKVGIAIPTAPPSGSPAPPPQPGG